MNNRHVPFLALLVFAAPALAQSPDGDAIAIVNGHPITRLQVDTLLMDSHGLEALQQLIVLELAKQETKRLNLEVTGADLAAEYKQSVDQIAAAAAGPGGAAMDEKTKRQALEAVLEKKGLSRAEFMVTMERNAHLRKVASQNLTFDERLIREEFARQYGEKVQVRHIQLADVAEVGKAVELLRGGTDFAEVARRLSRNPQSAADGGQIAPFAFNDDTLPPVLREAAFSLKPDEVSPAVRVDNTYHLLKLERRIPPDSVRFEDVRDKVAQMLRDKVIAGEMNQLAKTLFDKARVRVLHPLLKERYDDLLKKNELAQP